MRGPRRRSGRWLGWLVALACLWAGLPECPCPMAPAPDAAHGCCPTGLALTAGSCCSSAESLESDAARPATAVTAVSSPSAARTAVLAEPAGPPRLAAAVLSPPSPPAVLRI